MQPSPQPYPAQARQEESLKPLPNLLARSTATLFLLYALVGFVLISLVELGFLSSALALPIGIGFAVIQFTVGPFVMDWSLSHFYSLRWVQPQELPEDLRGFVEHTCRQHKMKFPSFGIIEDGSPEAFTYGHHPGNARIVISRGLLEMLAPMELAAVVGHEIGHARHWDMALMTIANLVPLLLYYAFRWVRRMGDDRESRLWGWGAALIVYLLYLLSEYIVLWFSRTRELYADRFGARATGQPNAMARALVKIAYGLAAAPEDATETTTANAGQPARKEKQHASVGLGVTGLAPLNIFDRKAALSMVMASANTSASPEDEGHTRWLDPERVKGAMQWERWNPWARWFELHSTHPLVATRLEYLGNQAIVMGQRPLIEFDRVQPQSYWNAFLQDMAIVSLPMAALLGGLAVSFYQWAEGPASFWPWQMLGITLGLFGLASLVKTLMSYSSFDFDHKTVADLMEEVHVSPVRPVAATLRGKIIGRGVPGLICSEDFVMRDKTGMILLDYSQPLAIWEMFFGLTKAGEFKDCRVAVRGWFRRAPVPYLEVYEMEVLPSEELHEKPMHVACHAFKAKLAWYGLLTILGLAIGFYFM
jgi:Zn-dependent protease with chaperone function